MIPTIYIAPKGRQDPPSESGELGLASRPGQPGLPDNPGSCISGDCGEPGEAGKPDNDGTDDGHDELAAGKPGRPGYTAYVHAESFPYKPYYLLDYDG